MQGNIHPTAIVSPTAIISPSAVVGAFSVIHDNVIIGNDVYIGSHVLIGTPPEYSGRKIFYPEKYNVVIGEGSVIYGKVKVDAPSEENGRTSIGRNCVLMDGAHVGHDTIIEDNVTMSPYSVLGGFSLVESYCTLGIGSCTHQKSILTFGTMLGANCFFKGVSKGMTIYVGVPASELKYNTRLYDKLRKSGISCAYPPQG